MHPQVSHFTMAANYLFVGDSFVKRLFNYRKALGKPFLVGGQEVEMRGWSGADVTTVRRHTVLTIRRWTPTVVVMQVGSNDLCNAACSPEHVVEDLLSFASFLVERCGVNRVVVCQILRRNSCVHLQGQNLGEYNAAVDRANALLKARCIGKIRYWEHHHSVRGESKLARDGIHLAEHCIKRYECSVRSALLYSIVPQDHQPP